MGKGGSATIAFSVTDWLDLLRGVCVFVTVFSFYFIFYLPELRANLTVRIHTFCFFIIVMRKRGKKRSEKRIYREMETEKDVREEGEVEKRSSEREVKACKEEERCKVEDLESHSTARRARISAGFTDSQETAIVEFAFYSRSQPVTESPSMTKLPQKLTRSLQKNMKISRF